MGSLLKGNTHFVLHCETLGRPVFAFTSVYSVAVASLLRDFITFFSIPIGLQSCKLGGSFPIVGDCTHRDLNRALFRTADVGPPVGTDYVVTCVCWYPTAPVGGPRVTVVRLRSFVHTQLPRLAAPRLPLSGSGRKNRVRQLSIVCQSITIEGMIKY